MKTPRVSLRSRLLYLAAAAFLPLAVVSGISLLALVHQQREQAERAGIEITRALSTAVDAELSRSFAALDALATSTLLDAPDLRRFHDRAVRVSATRSQWRSVILHDSKGRMVLNTASAFGAPLPPTTESESVAYVLREAQPAIGTISRGANGRYSFALRVPVLRDGELSYVLSAVISPDGIREVINRQRVPSDWVVSVFDARNQRVARSRQHEEFLGGPPAAGLLAAMEQPVHEGWILTPTIEGDKTYSAFTRSLVTGWTVAIGIPISYVDAGALRSLFVYGGGILLSIILAALAALLVGRGIARPMAELGEAARALGRREHLKLPDTPIVEIRQVAESLSFAADERTRGEAEREELLERERQARAIAEEANRSKDEFLAMLGHELRNPLGAISNAAQLLGAPDEESRTHARAVIGRQVQHLARMTDDLLDAARAMTGKIVLQRQPLDLAEAAARALATLRAAGRTGRRRLAERLEPVWVDADPTRIEQILGNLLGNALKFTPEGGTITISVEKVGDEAVLRVSDTGIGMPPALAARVFEPFVQGERPLDRSYGGLGIGLTLVRRLAELHGGSATAASEGPGQGSVFTVRLPAARAPQVERRRAGTKSSAPVRNVLVVEDNEDARETLRRMLELGGHHVRTAADGASGLEAVRSAPPEIALIDIGLPEMDGYELARRIRSEFGAGRQPYLVAVTGYGMPDDRKRTLEAGFDLHVVKPVDAALLADVLERG
ncbi:MAG: response regulator [Betaproteobacteria bacterium]|nr:response regulator [Betaproteobacteria bacterium]MBV9361860.1 response regulator [Betaproteobacteria bacterium]